MVGPRFSKLTIWPKPLTLTYLLVVGTKIMSSSMSQLVLGEGRMMALLTSTPSLLQNVPFSGLYTGVIKSTKHLAIGGMITLGKSHAVCLYVRGRVDEKSH